MEADVASSEEMLQRLEAEKKRHLAELAANRDALDEARQSVRYGAGRPGAVHVSEILNGVILALGNAFGCSAPVSLSLVFITAVVLPASGVCTPLRRQIWFRVRHPRSATSLSSKGARPTRLTERMCACKTSRAAPSRALPA